MRLDPRRRLRRGSGDRPRSGIFKVADYGILGDVFELLPKLAEAAKAHFASRG